MWRRTVWRPAPSPVLRKPALREAEGGKQSVSLQSARQSDNSQSRAMYRNFHRRAANILSIRINIQRMLGLDPDPACLKVLDFAGIQMVATVDARDQT